MKKFIIILTISLIAAVSMNAQEAVSKLDITGFAVQVKKAGKFSYKCDAEAEIKVAGGVLNAVASGDSKPMITIYMPSINEISVANCELEVDNKFKMKDLTLNMTEASTLTMNVDATKIYANLSDSSKLTIEGSVKDFTCNLNYSLLESTDLRADELTINAIQSSAVTMKIDAKRTEANASLSSAITLRGSSETLKCASESSSKILASRLNVRRAQATSIGNSEVAVNAAQLIADEAVKNLYGN